MSENPSEVADERLAGPDVFPVRMPALYVSLLYGFAALVAGLAAWFIKGGMYAAAGVLGIVFVPLTILYWYMLVATPSRTRILVGDGALVVQAPPYLELVVESAEVRRAFSGDMKADERLTPGDKLAGTSFLAYRSGRFRLPGGAEAVVVSRGTSVVALETGEGYVLLGPDDVAGLADSLRERMGVEA